MRAFGINPELVPTGEQSSLGLLDEFPPYDDIFDPVNRVLLPRADIATETLAEGLRERGWEIEDVTAYRTVRAAPPPAQTREMIKTGGFDAVCFTSSSTVRNLVGIAGKPHARTIVACIGPKTAETAAEFGLRVDVQPETRGRRSAGRGARRACRPTACRGCAAAAAQEEPRAPLRDNRREVVPLSCARFPSASMPPGIGLAGCAARRCVGWSRKPPWSQGIWCCRCSSPTASTSRGRSRRCPASSSTRATRCGGPPSRPSTAGVGGLMLFGVPARPGQGRHRLGRDRPGRHPQRRAARPGQGARRRHRA